MTVIWGKRRWQLFSSTPFQAWESPGAAAVPIASPTNQSPYFYISVRAPRALWLGMVSDSVLNSMSTRWFFYEVRSQQPLCFWFPLFCPFWTPSGFEGPPTWLLPSHGNQQQDCLTTGLWGTLLLYLVKTVFVNGPMLCSVLAGVVSEADQPSSLGSRVNPDILPASLYRLQSAD